MVTIQNMENAHKINPTGYNTHSEVVKVELYADSASDLSELTNEDLGLADTMKILAGSVAYDKDGNIYILDSNGTWNGVE